VENVNIDMSGTRERGRLNKKKRKRKGKKRSTAPSCSFAVYITSYPLYVIYEELTKINTNTRKSPALK